MSLINVYGNPVITNWEIDDNGNKISVPILNEQKQVTGNKIVLEGLPDEQYRVFIDGFVEIDIKEKIIEPNQFKVDYRKNGVIFVHESLDGQWLTVGKYYSVGMYYIPSSRVWTKLSDTGEILETLDDAVEKIGEISGIITDLDGSINTATGLKDELNTSISVGNTTKSNLDDSINNATTKKIQLDDSISSATVSKSNLDASIDSANTSKTNLDNSISTANSTKSNLDSSISSGNALKDNLDANIITGTTLNNSLDANISEGSQLKADLPPLISNANTSKSNLDSSISTANTKKTELDNSISSATTKKTELDNSISSANTINNTLSNSTTGTIKKATDINNTLNTTISNADTSKTNLDGSISNANTSKSNLDASILTANTTKTALDGSISEGNELKGDLNAIIEGTDFEQVITDVNSLKQDQHNHNNKTVLDTITQTKIDNWDTVTNKVDKVAGKQLSTEDYTTTEKNKLAGIATGATKNDTDANLKNRANHTGTQVSSTISDFANTVRSTALTGLSTATNAIISATDTVLSALGKLQKQISDNLSTTQTALDSKVDNSRVLTDVPLNAKFTDTITPIVNNLTETVTGKALDATQGKILDDRIGILSGSGELKEKANNDDLLNLEYSELSSIATNLDSEGIYKNIEWRRKDNTIYAKSTLLGTAPTYNQIKIDYYNENGNTIVKTITWDLTYDGNGFPYIREVI